MVLPPEDTLLLTRELIYTGITRAREAVTLWSDETVFSAAVKRRTERRSGLREMLVNNRLSDQIADEIHRHAYPCGTRRQICFK